MENLSFCSGPIDLAQLHPEGAQTGHTIQGHPDDISGTHLEQATNDISSPEVIGQLVQLWRPCRVVQLVVGVDVQSLWHDAWQWPSIQEARLKLLRWQQEVVTFIVRTTFF